MIRVVGRVMIVAATLFGCADDPPPATKDNAIAACTTWSTQIETQFGRCEGWDQQMLDDRINAGISDCYDRVEAEADTCYDNIRNSFEDCQDRDAEETCDDLCTPNGCFAICGYFCPPH